MAFFTRKKLETPAQAESQPLKPGAAEAKAPQQVHVSREPKKISGPRRMIDAIYQPHLTEKTSQATASGWYAFRVRDSLSKPAIKAAVEERYGVRVTRVRVSYRRPRTVRIGRITGTTPGFKKAMVKLAAGQTLEFVL